jgi:hypothetical protein
MAISVEWVDREGELEISDSAIDWSTRAQALMKLEQVAAMEIAGAPFIGTG